MQKKAKQIPAIIALMISAALVGAPADKKEKDTKESPKEEKSGETGSRSKSHPIFEIGAVGGLNANLREGLFEARPADNYQGGEAARLAPTRLLGVRAKFNFPFLDGVLGIRAGFLQFAVSEQSDTSNRADSLALSASTWEGSGTMIPISLTITPVYTKSGSLYLGFGMGPTSFTGESTLSTDLTGAANPISTKIESSSTDTNFVIGATANLTTFLSLSMELIVVRGGSNAATYSETDSPLDKIAISTNSELFLIGVNFQM